MSTWRVTVKQFYDFDVEADSFEEAMEVATETPWEEYQSEAEIKVEKFNE